MSMQENAQIGAVFFGNINAHDLEKNVALQADDVQTEAPAAAGPMTREQYQAYLQGFITAFPDLHFDIARTIADNDFVVVHWVGHGTHNGPLLSPSGATIPPTGKTASVPGTSTLEIRGGQIIRNWVHFDMLSLLGQLGLLPPM